MIKDLNFVAIIFFLTITFLNGSQSITIKVFHVYESFGTQTEELKNSIEINYNNNNLIIDSTIYSHLIPLSKKYVYVSGENEGLQLQHKYDKKTILSYQFEYDNHGNRVSTTLYGTNDSLYWKEFQKHDNMGKIIKTIRYDPGQAINPEMIGKSQDPGKLIWAEAYNYNDFGNSFERRELYDNYCLVISTYSMDSTKTPKKIAEYFDPSVLFQTTFFHNENGLLSHKVSVGHLGQSLGSTTYEYDIQGRIIKKTIYNGKGIIQEILSTVFNDDSIISYDYFSDSLLKLSSIKELLLDRFGRPYIETVVDSDERVIEKNVYYYDEKGRINEIKNYDMIRRGREENEKIPIRVHTYEYD